MSNQKDRKAMERLDKIYNMVLQSSTKGMRAVEIADKLETHKTMVYRALNSLNLMGKVESDQGIWRAKKGEQTIKPLEKEILIMLPLPKKLVQHAIAVEMHAKYVEGVGMPELAAMERIILEKIDESRSIRIKGKNVDDLDLEKLGSLIQQASQNSSRLNLRGLFKGLKMPKLNSPTDHPERPEQAAHQKSLS